MKYPKKTTFPRSNEFSLGKGPISLGRRAPSLKAMNFPQGRAQVPKETYVLNIFATITISCSFVYKLVTYHL
jgi:hypothetical protein